MIIKLNKPTRQFVIETENGQEFNDLVYSLPKHAIRPVNEKSWGLVHKTNRTILCPEIYWQYLDCVFPKINSPLLNQYKNNKQIVNNKLNVKSKAPFCIDDYQYEGANWLMESGRVVGDVVGLGKTVQALLAYEELRHNNQVEKMLVLCPKIAIAVWEAEWRLHLDREPSRELLAINYDQMLTTNGYKRINDFLNSCPNQRVYVVFDEVHSVGSVSSQRFEKLEAMILYPNHFRVGLTGTWLRNRSHSFYAPYRIITGADVKQKEFNDMFWSSSGRCSLRTDALHSVFMQFTLRREAKDVKIDMPRATKQVMYLKMKGEQKKVYDQLKEELLSTIKSEYANRDKNKWLDGKMLGLLNKQLTAASHPAFWDSSFPDNEVEKVKVLHEILDNFQDTPFIVWGVHPAILERLAKKFKDRQPEVLHGGLPKKVFEERKNRFLNNKDSTLIFLSLEGCYQAMNGLQHKVSHALYYDLSWKEIPFSQSVGRIVRRGQISKIVNLYYLVYEESIDNYVFQLLNEKHKENMQIYKNVKESNVFSSVNLSEFMKKV